MRLTEQDIGRFVVIGSDPNGGEVYPEQVAVVADVHLIQTFDCEPGDADWATVYLKREYRVPQSEWSGPKGDPWRRTEDDGRRNIGFENILRFA